MALHDGRHRRAVELHSDAVSLPATVLPPSSPQLFFCERAVGFSSDVGLQDEAYFDAIVRMFWQALLAVLALPPKRRAPFMARLDAVRQLAANVGYGVGDEMGEVLDRHAVRP